MDSTIAKGTEMMVNHKTRGRFMAEAREDFSVEADMYPLTVTKAGDAACVKGEELRCRAELVEIECTCEELDEGPLTPEEEEEWKRLQREEVTPGSQADWQDFWGQA